MSHGPNIAGVAALIGDRARADILTALLSGKALTATELAHAAGVTKQTASAHLSKLVARKLLLCEKQGRHRYFRLADDDLADMLEGLMGVAQRIGAVRLQLGPNEPALRRSRVCYDHLAGEIGVKVVASVREKQLVQIVGEGAELTARGSRFFSRLGIDIDALTQLRRPMCRLCLDWSERRHHLAGALGSALLQLFFQRRWAIQIKHSRIVTIAPAGTRALREHFAVQL